MQLLIIRHGIAEDKDAFARTGRPDTERPLTAEGIAEMERVARGLHRALGASDSIDVLAASPLVRAAQTAVIVAGEYGGPPVATVPALAPDRAPQEFVDWLTGLRNARVVAAVGHEPHLGVLITWLLSGKMESRVEIEKGGTCLLHFDSVIAAGQAKLQWALTPNLAAQLGGE